MTSALSKFHGFISAYQIPLAIFIVSRFVIILLFILLPRYDLGEARFDQWDAEHYVFLSEHGYQVTGSFEDKGALIAYFPLFPIVLNVFHHIVPLDTAFSGAMLSIILGLVCVVLLYKLVSDWKGKEAPISAVLLFSFYPSSVFLSAPYTESLFLLLVLATFTLMRRKNYWGATAAVALSCVTRITGSVLGLVFAWQTYKETKSWPRTLLYAALAGIPFFIFLHYQLVHYGDAFAFLTAQKEFWHHTATFPWIGLANFIWSVIFDIRFSAMWRTDAFWLFAIIATLFLSYKKIPRDIWLFGLGIVLLSLSNTFILSMSRYMIMVLPFYFYWGDVLSKKPHWRTIVIAVLSGWMVLNSTLFLLGKLVL